MTDSLNKNFPYSVDLIVYYYFPGNTLDYREVKTLSTILWIIKWSDGVNEIDCFEIVKRAVANYGQVFDFDEREVTWGIIRLLEKGILSAVFMGPAEDLPLRSSIVPAIKIVKVNNKELVADALADNNIENTIIVTADDGDPACLKSKNMQLCNTLSREQEIIINNISTSIMQSDESSSMERYKN